MEQSRLPHRLDSHLPERLQARLAEPLPGWRVQRRLQPELSFGRHFGPPPATARHAAVLVLLYEHAGRWHVPLTLRPEALGAHGGQISLPGGVLEPNERSSDAALRELREELGVSADGLQLIGQLSSVYLFASNFQITPWLATSRRRPDFAPNPAEVDLLLEVPLDHLRDPSNFGSVERQKLGVIFRAPALRFGSHEIWGATSMILAELLALI